MLFWGHPISTYAKCFEKLTFLAPWYADVRVRVRIRVLEMLLLGKNLPTYKLDLPWKENIKSVYVYSFAAAISLGLVLNLHFNIKVGNITFWKILNVAICYIFICLNINLNIIKGIRDTKNYWNCKFQEAEPEWTWIFFSQTFLQKTYRDEFTKLSKVGLSWKV